VLKLAWPTSVVAALLMTAGPAFAETPPGPACDYYQNLLIGTLCERTVDLGLGVGNNHREITNSFSDPFLQEVNKTTVNFLTLSGSASITPLSWLKLTLGSSGVVQSNSASSSGTSAGFPPFLPPRTFSFSSSSQQAYAGFQTLQVLANVIDVGAGDSRTIVNVFAGGGFVPGTDLRGTPSEVNARWQSEWFGGLEGNGEWRLPGSTYSIVSRTGLQLHQEQVRSRTILQPAQSVLLSNDAWGVAAGPVVYADILTSQAGGVGSSPNSVNVGVEVRAQPLRTLPVPFLRDLTAAIGVFHSVGQAAFVDTRNGKASALAVNADFAWHFGF
jgi:hypothetical protein